MLFQFSVLEFASFLYNHKYRSLLVLKVLFAALDRLYVIGFTSPVKHNLKPLRLTTLRLVKSSNEIYTI